MGRRGDESWRSIESARIGAARELGATLGLFDWARRRVPSFARHARATREQLESLQGLAKTMVSVEQTLARIDDAATAITVHFPDAPQCIESLRAASARALQEALSLSAAARSVALQAGRGIKRGGFIAPLPTETTRAEFIRMVLFHPSYALYSEIPTDPASAQHEVRRKLIQTYEAGLCLSPKGWALGAIAVGIDPRCESADEFWDRVRNSWRGELSRILKQLKPYGVSAVDGRAHFARRILGGKPSRKKVPPKNRR